jgi:archaellum component FlaC
MGAEEKAHEVLLRPIEEQIKALRELTDSKFSSLSQSLTKDVENILKISEGFDKRLRELEERLDGKYVSREFLAQSIIVLQQSQSAEFQKVYDKFNPIRSILIYVATTVGGVLLVAISIFVFSNLKFQ